MNTGIFYSSFTRHLKRVLIPVILVFGLFGCSSSPQQSGSRQPTSCNINFYNDPAQSLCRWYYDGFGSYGTACDPKIIAELERQGRSVFPRSSCGQPKQTATSMECKRKYSSTSTQTLCDVYHSNRDLPCDPSIRDIFNERRQNLIPRSSCGTPTQSAGAAQSSVCRRSVTGESTANLCTLYWDNLDFPCDALVREEIIRRNGTIGSGKNSCIQFQAASNVQACTGHTIGKLNSISQQEMCTLAASKTDCSRVAEALLIGKGLKSKQGCGGVAQDECSSLVRTLASRTDGVTEACRIKSDKNQLIGVKCRRSINGFLLGKQVSPGNSSAACGQPVRPDDLAAFRSSQ